MKKPISALMLTKTYDWKRYWCPRHESYQLTEDGFLADPEELWAAMQNPALHTLDAASQIHCLALLGEPGIGKSNALNAELDGIRKGAGQGDTLQFVDLRSIGSEERLFRKIFEDPAFINWTTGTHRLHLFLDSLDECSLHVPTLAQILIDELKSYPVSRLSLRIACRTANWPAFLEEGLSALWGKEHFEVLELAPLRKRDIALAADVEGVNANTFLAAVREADAAAFAIKPVTLKFLLQKYKLNGHLPTSQKALYAEGCRILCAEENTSRIASGNTRQFTETQRLAVASRIAAVTVFSNRYALYTGPDLGVVPEGCLPISALSGGKEIANDLSFEVDESILRETLDTGLFSSRGSGLIGWAHKTYEEFLAAKYILERALPLDQVCALITHASATDATLVPQLQETAARLAIDRPDILQSVMESDPLILLTSDVAAVEARDRAAIVERMLQNAEVGRMVYREIPHLALLRKLKHPDLAVQLQPYLTRKSGNIVGREAAICIAEACGCLDLQQAMLAIALDTDEPITLRIRAAYTVSRIGDDTHKKQLRPLAQGTAGEDPDDELKGCALTGLWPGLCTAHELFSYLTPPQNESLGGAYSSFIYHKFTPHLVAADLLLALQWASQHHGRRNRLSGAVADILRLAWKHLDEEGVLDAFTEVVYKRIKAFEPVFPDDYRTESLSLFAENTAKRRALIGALVQRVTDEKEQIPLIAFAIQALSPSEDFGWALEQASLPEEAVSCQAYAKIARHLFDWQDSEQFEALYNAALKASLLRTEFADILQPVDLNSEKAQQQKDWYEQDRAREESRVPILLTPSPSERVENDLTAFEVGNANAWSALNYDLQLREYDTQYQNDHELDLTLLPGWEAAAPETRDRIVVAAEQYLHQGIPRTEELISSNTLYSSDCAGYRALHLLHSESGDILKQLPEHIWIKWTPIVVFYPVANHGPAWEQYQRLLPICYRQAPQSFVSALIQLIDRDNAAGRSPEILDVLSECWDADLAAVLVNKAADPALNLPPFEHILSTLLKGGEEKRPNPQAVALAVNVVKSALTNSKRREVALVAAKVLLVYCPEEGWADIWGLIACQEDFGKALFVNIASQGQLSSLLLSHLSEGRLETLYCWLVEQYPYESDPEQRTMEAHAGSPAERIRRWRDEVLATLKGRGTSAACAALERLVSQLPHLLFLPFAMRQVRDLMLRNTWEPPSPEALLRIAQESDARLVRNGSDLLRVVRESLERLQQKLQGETYASPFLWDRSHQRDSSSLYSPKDENSLSDYVKNHLEEDLQRRGIIANREVEIRRNRGNAAGERIDIYIDAIVQSQDTSAYRKVSVIVEIKGCWNRELLTAMDMQLAKRYLADNDCQHGLYLVGWYDCPQWDREDYRKMDVPKMTLDELKARLDLQAAELSGGDITIVPYLLNVSLR